MSMVSCQKGPTRHAYAWQIGPFWQDTLDARLSIRDILQCTILLAFKTSLQKYNIFLKKVYKMWLCAQLIYFHFRFDSTIYIEFFSYQIIVSSSSS